MAPWAYKPVAMSVVATPTYSFVTGVLLPLSEIRINLAWWAVGFTSAVQDISQLFNGKG